MFSKPFTTYAVACAVALVSWVASVVVTQQAAQAWFAARPLASGTYFVVYHAAVSKELGIFVAAFGVNTVVYGIVSVVRAPLDVRLVAWQMRVTSAAFALAIVPEVAVMLARPGSWLYRYDDPVRVAFANVGLVALCVAIGCVPLGVASVVVALRARKRAARG